MYRITKVLNHNTVLAVKDKSAREYIIVGKDVDLQEALLYAGYCMSVS